MTTPPDPTPGASGDDGVPGEASGAYIDTEVRDLLLEWDEVVAAEARAQAARASVLARAGRVAYDRIALISNAAGRDREMPLRQIAAELAGAARLNDRSVQHQLADAVTLREEFPLTFAAYTEARVHRLQVDQIVHHGSPIDDPEAREAFEHAALRFAETLAPAPLGARLAVVAEELNPRSLSERHHEAAQSRGVSLRFLPDGMSQLTVITPAVIGKAIYDRLTSQARELERLTNALDAQADAGDRAEERGNIFTGDHRTLDQRRVDILSDTLLTSVPTLDPTPDPDGGGLGAIRAHVQITVPVLALATPRESAGSADSAGSAGSGASCIVPHPSQFNVLSRPSSRRRV